MKVLVTGANGYLGRGIVEALLCEGHQVIATDVKLDIDDHMVRKVECNLFDLKDPINCFGLPDAVLHLAWRDGFVHNSPNHIIDLPSHYFFLKSMIEAGVKQVCVMGTMHEIGFYEGSIDENTPCNPLNLYGVAKNALRQSIEIFSKTKKCRFQWLRGYYIVGKTECGSSIFSKILAAERGGELEFPFTKGMNQYDFLDYEDFCLQVVATIEQNDINGIINICSGKPEKLGDRVEKYLKDNNLKIRLKYGAYPDREYDSLAVWGNNKKIKLILKTKNHDY